MESRGLKMNDNSITLKEFFQYFFIVAAIGITLIGIIALFILGINALI